MLLEKAVIAKDLQRRLQVALIDRSFGNLEDYLFALAVGDIAEADEITVTDAKFDIELV